jgi:hypothetical protein
MVSAFRRAASFRGDSAVTTWLQRIVVNAWLDRMRRRAGRTINALECLAQSGEKRLVPDASTKLFLDLMQDFAPGRPSRSRLNKIYEVRSLVTHCERLLGYDTPQTHGTLESLSSAPTVCRTGCQDR